MSLDHPWVLGYMRTNGRIRIIARKAQKQDAPEEQWIEIAECATLSQAEFVLEWLRKGLATEARGAGKVCFRCIRKEAHDFHDSGIPVT